MKSIKKSKNSKEDKQMKSAYPSASMRMTFILVFFPPFSSSLSVPTPVNIPVTSTEKGKSKKKKH